MLLAAVPAVEAPDPLTCAGKRPWLVTCFCGWERESSSEGAPESVSTLGPQLAPTGGEHATRVEDRAIVQAASSSR